MMRGTVQQPAKARAAYGKQAQDNDTSKKVPTLEEFIIARDFIGAITLLQCRKPEANSSSTEWLAYSQFHAGQYAESLATYQSLLKHEDADANFNVYAAACLFYLGRYAEAQEIATKGPATALRNRVMFHCVHAIADEDQLVQYHSKLTSATEDQLSLAAVHFRRSHFQEATDIYKRILIEHKDYSALNIYIALCYSRLEYYDVSQDILKQYLAQYPDSVLVTNLKSCNNFRLFDGEKAEAELQAFKTKTQSAIQDNDLIRHNIVVFRSGENAMRDLHPLVGLIPEARLNLVVYYLRKGELQPAFDLMKEVEPSQPQEYILKGVVHAALGQSTNDSEHLKMAQQFFQLVGASASECDTIPGRQCMASCFFLLKQFDDVLIFLNSIQAYFLEDDDFNWNHGITLASTGSFDQAETALLLVKSEAYKKEHCYWAWLARCYIRNSKPQEAWKLYLRTEGPDDCYQMLLLLANECYTMGHFFYSAKAFQVLERLDPDPKFFEGKRGACVGCLQMMIANKESPSRLPELITILKDSSNPKATPIINAMSSWGASNGIAIK